MWPDRRLIERLNIVHPIIQAPMGGASTPELVAAVSNTGAMGWLGAAMHSPEALRAGRASRLVVPGMVSGWIPDI